LASGFRAWLCQWRRLAATIGMEPGEEVQWELLERGELHLVRAQVPRPQAKARRRATA